MSPKSFGHFFYSQQPADGLQYLGVNTEFSSALPGNELLNGMCVWLTHLKDVYELKLSGIEIDRPGYLIRQAYYWLTQYFYGVTPWNQFVRRIRLLSFGDWISIIGVAIRPQTLKHMFRALYIRSKTHTELLWHNLLPLRGPRDIREFAQWLERENRA